MPYNQEFIFATAMELPRRGMLKKLKKGSISIKFKVHIFLKFQISRINVFEHANHKAKEVFCINTSMWEGSSVRQCFISLFAMQTVIS